jgi:hypothetical protein
LSKISSTLARLAGLRVLVPLKDDVLHGLATQLAGFALAQHPTHGIHDVGLAATIGPHHAHQLPRQRKLVGSANDLKPDNLMELRRTEKWSG